MKKFSHYTFTLFALTVLLLPASASAFSIFGWSFSDLFGSSLNNDLVGHWTFDGKNMVSNVADTSSSGYSGTLSGQTSTTTTSGVLGQALSFDGTDDFVELGRVLLNITIPVSISMWVKPDANTGTQTIFHSNTPNTDCCNYRGVWVNLDAGNTISVNYGSGTANTAAGRRSKQSATALTDGVWTHVVAVVRGATDMTIYFDGVDAGGTYSGTGGALAVVDDPAWSARIGWNEQGSAVHYDGLLDDVRFYNRALSATEVNRLYKMGAKGAKAGAAPSGGTLAAGGNSGLVGHWTFDGKNMVSNVTDSSGQGNTGRLILGATGNTATTTTFGPLGQALSFDGVSDYVTVADNNSLDTGTGDFTYNIWVKALNINQYATLISKRMTGAPFTQTNLTICTIDASGVCTASKKISGVIYQDSFSTAHFFYTTDDVIDGNWHMVTLVRDGALSARIYVDGVAKSLTTPRASGNPNVTNNQPLVIGDDQSGHFLGGLVDDARVYNRALSAEEVKRLYTAGVMGAKTGTTPSSGTLSATGGLVGHWTFDGKHMISNVADASGNGNNGRLIGQTATTSVIGILGQALFFDGTNDYVSIGDVNALDGVSALTISVWVRGSALADYKDIVAKQTSATSRIVLITGGTLDVGNDDLLCGIANGSDTYGSTNTNVFSPNVWYHVVCVFDGSQTGNSNRLKLYIDSTEQALAYAGTIPATTPSGAASFNIGLNTGSNYWKGNIDDVRIYNRALSTEEVERLYNLGR